MERLKSHCPQPRSPSHGPPFPWSSPPDAVLQFVEGSRWEGKCQFRPSFQFVLTSHGRCLSVPSTFALRTEPQTLTVSRASVRGKRLQISDHGSESTVWVTLPRRLEGCAAEHWLRHTGMCWDSLDLRGHQLREAAAGQSTHSLRSSPRYSRGEHQGSSVR